MSVERGPDLSPATSSSPLPGKVELPPPTGEERFHRRQVTLFILVAATIFATSVALFPAHLVPPGPPLLTAWALALVIAVRVGPSLGRFWGTHRRRLLVGLVFGGPGLVVGSLLVTKAVTWCLQQAGLARVDLSVAQTAPIFVFAVVLGLAAARAHLPTGAGTLASALVLVLALTNSLVGSRDEPTDVLGLGDTRVNVYRGGRAFPLALMGSCVEVEVERAGIGRFFSRPSLTCAVPGNWMDPCAATVDRLVEEPGAAAVHFTDQSVLRVRRDGHATCSVGEAGRRCPAHCEAAGGQAVELPE